MDSDSKAFQHQLLRLLRTLLPSVSTADIEALAQMLQDKVNPSLSSSSFSVSNLPSSSSHRGADFSTPSGESLLDFGDIPAVQDRFQALLKHRLQTEIQQNPPLFPWETEIHDYETDRSPGLVGLPVGLWWRQLTALSIPTALPNGVLAQLLQQCQEVAQTSLQEGARLVRVVEELFPDQTQALNYLAGLVVTSPARSGGTALTPAATEDFPPSYEAAAPAQQMVLSLLAAQEILASLTLKLTPGQSQTCHWQTEAGTLTVWAAYDPVTCLRVQVTLPVSGELRLRAGAIEAKANRPDSGYLSAELFGVQPGQICTLEVAPMDQTLPLTFAIHLT
jgi:hypothetical protein